MPSEPGANVSSVGPLRNGAESLDLLSLFPSEAEANDAAPGPCNGGMSAALTTANVESAALAARRLQPREDPVFEQSVADVAAFKRELARLSEVAGRLTAEYSRIEHATRAAEERSIAALEIVNVLETRLGPLAMLQDLRRRTDARLAALNVLTAAAMSAYAYMTSLRRRLARVMTRLPRRTLLRSRRHHSVVVGAPGVLVLASFIVARSLWTQIRFEASQ